MRESEKQAILANVKKVEQEELAKIAAKLAEWKAANNKDSKSATKSKSSDPTKKSSKSEKMDSKKKQDEGSAKAEKPAKKEKTESTKAEKKEKTETINPKWQEAAVALEGDNSRKSKFMRLMGAGNVKVAAPQSAVALKGELKKREAELGKQFEHGLKMKNEVGAKRRGLGA